MEGVYINGAPQGITFHETDEYTIYPASILTVSKNRFTKHYFIGDKRVASRIGTGQFNNVYGQNGSYVTAGQQDYTERLNQIQSKKEDYYKELGIAPGVPTMKGAYGDPENTGVGYNTVITELGDHSVPEGWIQTPRRNTEPNAVPGTPVSWNDPIKPENPDAGYGFIPSDTADVEETFFFHSDHLGSTSYITDDKGNITQYDAYLPYGELLVDEHSSSEEMPYKFNGKELDEETGLYYYGARYMQPVASIWYGVDPLTEKYPNVSAYVYCGGNPVNRIDPNGKEIWVYYDDEEGNEQSFQYSVGMNYENLNSSAQSLVKNFNEMAKNSSGAKVLNAIIESPTKYGFKQTETHSMNGEGFFDMATNTISLNDPTNTLTFAEEVFHTYQRANDQGGATAVAEVEAKLFSAKMNCEIEGWANLTYYTKLAGNDIYSDTMQKMFREGYSDDLFEKAVNNFFTGSYSGNVYKSKGYKQGDIVGPSLIKQFLPAKE